jgi:inner membrane protein
MNPITHLFASWTVGEQLRLNGRDLALISWAGVAADLDGLTLIPDVVSRIRGGPETFYYGEYHHMLTHGLPAALVLAAAAFLISRRKWKIAVLAFLVFHLHLFCDLIGARGPSPDDIWPIPYFAPFSDALTFAWSGQWALNAWPNIFLTLLLLALIFRRAYVRGYSPLLLFSVRADKAFVGALKHRFGTYADA